MSEIIKNRHEFMFYVSCVDANPNGDPDMGNMPRVDPDTMHGIMTDASIKRRVRDYVSLFKTGEPGMDIFVEAGVNLNRKAAEVKVNAGVELSDKTPAAVSKASLAACSKFWDVRTFGAVMSTGPNAGQVRGPVQIPFARSLDPIQPQDIGITRVACADNESSAKSVDDWRNAESKSEADKLRTMGRKQFAPYGLYEIRGFVSARLAAQTGFTEDDLLVLMQACANMYDATRSASKGTMSVVSPVIIFRHDGDSALPEEARANQALLGRMPAYRIFESVRVEKKPGIVVPRSHHDYTAEIDMCVLHAGVKTGYLMPYADEICWGSVPADSDWLTAKA